MESVKLEDCSQTLELNVNIKDEEEEEEEEEKIGTSVTHGKSMSNRPPYVLTQSINRFNSVVLTTHIPE